jgi:ubiquitin C-terminal hydrolase
MKILDRLHTETKIVVAKPKVLKMGNSVTVQKLWENHLANHESVTSRVFEGLQKVTINCSGCKNNFIKHEIFSVLSLILGEKETELEKILTRNYQPEAFVNDSMLECQTCKSKQKATKLTRIVHVPEVLVMTLKRFQYDPKICNFVKIDREISYKTQGFGLPMQVSEGAVSLELFAVIVSLFKHSAKQEVSPLATTIPSSRRRVNIG